MKNNLANQWNELAVELDDGGDDAVDRIVMAALANPQEQAASLLIRALAAANSESSKRAAAIALAFVAAPDNVEALECLEEAYSAARKDASLGPVLLKTLGLYGLRCLTARSAAITAILRLKVTDTSYLLIAGAKVAALLLVEQDDTGLHRKLSELVESNDFDIQSEVRYQLAFLALIHALEAPTQSALLAGLQRANSGFAAAVELVELRPDAKLLGLLVNLILKFDSIDNDRQITVSSIIDISKRLRAEVGGIGERLFPGYNSPYAIRLGQKVVEIAGAIESAAEEVAESIRWTNFDRSIVRLAECVNLIRSKSEATLGSGRIYDALVRIADRLVTPRLGPVLMRKVGRESLIQVITNYRELYGDDEILIGLVILQEAERAAELTPGKRLSEEKYAMLTALAAKVQLSPDDLVESMAAVVSKNQGVGWAVTVGLLPQPSIVRRERIDKMLNVDVVVITVNDRETEAVYAEFESATGAKAVPISLEGRLYHNLGVVNGTIIFHAFSEMGSGGVGGMQQTVDKAIRALDPGAVIAVGIAFGVNHREQEIGDILLSKQLRPYDLQRFGKEIILRGDKPSSSAWLFNHFKGFARTGWYGAGVRDGVILSGDKLIDNIDYRDQLLQLETEAIGGEMEGSGLYVSSHEHKVDWIVVKAICDWADGNKSEDKTHRQKKAARNAAEFVRKAVEYAPLKQ